MDTKLVSYTFDRKSGELLNKEVKGDVDNKDFYIQGVVSALINGLEEYVNRKNEHGEMSSTYNIA